MVLKHLGPYWAINGFDFLNEISAILSGFFYNCRMMTWVAILSVYSAIKLLYNVFYSNKNDGVDIYSLIVLIVQNI